MENFTKDTTVLARSPLFDKIGAVVKALNTVSSTVSVLGVIAALSLIAWSVVMRYVFNDPPIWTDEFVGYLLVAIVMLAVGESFRRGAHFGVDTLTSNLSQRWQRVSSIWSSLAVLVTAMILMVNGWETAMFAKSLGMVTEGQLEWPQYLLMLLLPLGGFILGVNAIESILRQLAGLPEAERVHQEKQE